jgi:hypothetical protein
MQTLPSSCPRRRSASASALVLCTLVATAAAALPAGEAGAARRAPVVKQLVVFKGGNAIQKRVRARAVTVRVAGGRRCAAGRATPLAALVRSRPGALRIEDSGGDSCSLRAADGGQLYVRSIAGQRARGEDGWVYKVGRRLATAGAADPTGPFGNGRLRSGRRVTWFYGRSRAGGEFQRTLELRVAVAPGGRVIARVRGYDNEGRGVAVAGARVSVRGGTSALTDAGGIALLTLPTGTHTLKAEKQGLVRSFSERVRVR